MKKSDKKKMIYDAMALRLAVALEWVLGRLPPRVKIDPDDSMKRQAITLCNYFRAEGADKRDAEAAVRVVKKRHEIAHPGENGGYRPQLTEQDFRKVREDCRTTDELLAEFCDICPEQLPMSNLMFHSLPYDMGNAGDLIKHGALVHFVNWKNGKGGAFRFADPFGGCPWEIVENDEIKRRMRSLEKADNDVAKCLWRKGRYYNSGHIVNSAARQCGGKAMVRTSDESDIARSDLVASAIHADNMELLGKKYPRHKCNDGYSILPHAGEFDLVLLDPFADFLLNESKNGFATLAEIKNIPEDVCVAVFVLDWRDNYVHKSYDEFKREKLRDIAISLRCPKIPDSGVSGESKYNMEMLLISKMFANGRGDGLRRRLMRFGDAVQKVLFPHGDKKIEIWPRPSE